MLSETKLNVLKQISGDLSRDEAIWASGYLAGLAGGTLTATLPPQQQDIPVQNAVKKSPWPTVRKPETAKNWQPVWQEL